MRILILGDSLPFPRPAKGQPLRATWPSLLKERLPQSETWLRAHTRFTIIDVLKELGFFTESLTEFDAIIVQTGIVDCAPRPYPHFIARLIDVCVSMPTYRKIERFTHQRLLWLYRRPWVSEGAFSATAERLVQTAYEYNPTLKVLFIPIAPPNRTIVKSLPGIDSAAGRYNEALEAKVKTLSPKFGCQCLNPFYSANPLDVTIDDGHHLSSHGHELIADAIAQALEPHYSAHLNRNHS